MRDDSLMLADFHRSDLKVIDVGSGTGFTTQGIVKHIKPEKVTCVDQSPHQMAKAKVKSNLKACNFHLGDAENIPVATDQFDRYVSAGSIEYWPHPQKGITEAYRVIKPGGVALMIGPLEPPHPLARFAANTWMLFPKDQEYRDWFKNAGFQDIKVKYVSPHWIKQKDKYCIAISGVKPSAGLSPIHHQEEEKATKTTEEKMTLGRSLLLFWRVLIGSLAGFVFIPLALFGYLRNSFNKKEKLPEEYRERLNIYQIIALVLAGIALISIVKWLF